MQTFSLKEIIINRLKSGPKTAIQIADTMFHANIVEISDKLKAMWKSGDLIYEATTRKYSLL